MIKKIVVESIQARITLYTLGGLCMAMVLLTLQIFSLGEYTMSNAVDDWIKSMFLLAAADCIDVIYRNSRECNDEESE